MHILAWVMAWITVGFLVDAICDKWLKDYTSEDDCVFTLILWPAPLFALIFQLLALDKSPSKLISKINIFRKLFK
jgi:hypothetical protein